MPNSSKSSTSEKHKTKNILVVALFLFSYVLFLYSISNKLGKHVLKGTTLAGEYIPHDYYTGFTTEMPFKIVLGTITLLLLIWVLRTHFSTAKTLLLLPVALFVLTFIGYMLAFFLFWGL